MDGEGHNVGWNSNARVGLTIASPEGSFALMQYPGVKLGEEFKFPIFLVNEDNGKMVEFDFTYSIVETVVEEEELEEVGEEVIVVPVDQNGAIATLDLKNVAEKLGTTVDDLTAGEYLHGMTASGTYGGGVEVLSSNPLSFSIKGKATTDADEVFMWFDKAELSDDGILSITTMSTSRQSSNQCGCMGLPDIPVDRALRVNKPASLVTFITGTKTNTAMMMAARSK